MENETIDSIAVASAEDSARFLAYLPYSRSFRSVYSRKYFEWKLERNPFGFSRAYLRSRGGRAAAHCSVTAKPMNRVWLEGVRLAELGDTHTHPHFQRQGHFGVIGLHTIEQFQASERGEALIYGLPNDNALPGWQSRCGCEVWPEMGIRHLVIAMSARPGQWGRALISGRDEVRLRYLDHAVAEGVIDEFWSRIADPSHLIQKTGAWWRWRYAGATETYRTYVALRRDEVVGWCVLKRAELLPLVGRTTVCDILANSGLQAEILKVLLYRIVHPLDAVSIWVQGDTELDRGATQLGFLETRRVPVVFYANAAYRRLRSSRVPILSVGDTDNV